MCEAARCFPAFFRACHHKQRKGREMFELPGRAAAPNQTLTQSARQTRDCRRHQAVQQLRPCPFNARHAILDTTARNSWRHPKRCLRLVRAYDVFLSRIRQRRGTTGCNNTCEWPTASVVSEMSVVLEQFVSFTQSLKVGKEYDDFCSFYNITRGESKSILILSTTSVTWNSLLWNNFTFRLLTTW